VTLEDREAARLWSETAAAFLAHSARTPALLEGALSRAPDFALGHAAHGLFLCLLARRELAPAIARDLRAAQAAEARGLADAREAEYVRALEALAAGRMFAAAQRLEAVAARWPQDALAVKLAHAVRFMLGDAPGMRAAAEAAVARLAPDHPHLGYLMGCRAFAREETGDYAAAEAEGRAGLDLAPDDAWGLHAVAHVMDMTGRAEQGARWLAERPAAWAHCNNFGYHVWWHLALFRIDRGEFAEALALYDEKVRPEPADDFRDIANAASLLLRLELEGAETGERWEELGGLCANRTEDGCLVFADLHYLLALNRTGRQAEADALTARIAADAQGLDHDQHEVCALAGLPVARGLNAFRAGRWAEAERALSLALPNLFRTGGSHAQRDVFERIAIEAALRAGRCARAEEMLAARALRRGAEDGYTARRREAIAARRAELRAAKVAAE
jgi:hypothetical protein